MNIKTFFGSDCSIESRCKIQLSKMEIDANGTATVVIVENTFSHDNYYILAEGEVNLRYSGDPSMNITSPYLSEQGWINYENNWITDKSWEILLDKDSKFIVINKIDLNGNTIPLNIQVAKFSSNSISKTAESNGKVIILSNNFIYNSVSYSLNDPSLPAKTKFLRFDYSANDTFTVSSNESCICITVEDV
jgi:hypothetical protein